jgi:hypothetical protein
VRDISGKIKNMIYRAGEDGLSSKAIRERLGTSCVNSALTRLRNNGEIEMFGSGRTTLYRKPTRDIPE